MSLNRLSAGHLIVGFSLRDDSVVNEKLASAVADLTESDLKGLGIDTDANPSLANTILSDPHLTVVTSHFKSWCAPGDVAAGPECRAHFQELMCPWECGRGAAIESSGFQELARPWGCGLRVPSLGAGPAAQAHAWLTSSSPPPRHAWVRVSAPP